MSIISNCLIGKNKMGTWVFSRILYSRNRDITFDLIRACSMIFIVCILHFSQYTFYEEWYKTYFAEVITGVSLSFFTFISGFLLVNLLEVERLYCFIEIGSLGFILSIFSLRYRCLPYMI